MNDSWKQDPRVRAMHPEKIQFLADMTTQFERIPKNQLASKFLSLMMEANQKGVSFTDQETDLLAGILSNYMPPAERGKLDTLRLLSRKLAQKK